MLLSNDRASVEVDPRRGGRVASIRIDGSDILVEERADPLQWGCYPMVPFAGRIDRGRFEFGGVSHELPATMGEHAIHGYGYAGEWTNASLTEIEWHLAQPWPFAGSVRQRFELMPHSLRIEMSLTAAERQPFGMGWHPWFRRRVAGETATLEFDAAEMYELDGEIPTGRRIPPPPGPWDNCFTGVTVGPRLHWGGLTVALSSSADHWVVFDQPHHALCVEPQTGPPDEVNRSPRVLDAGESATIWFIIDWSYES